MATPIVQNAVYRTITYIQDNAQVAVLTRDYLAYAVPLPPLPNMGDFAANFCAIMAPLYKALIHNGANFKGCTVHRLSGPGPFEISEQSTVGAGPGTAGTIALPKQVSGLVSFNAAFRGRSFRGRQYVPFPSAADDIGDGIPTTAYILKLLALGAALKAPISATGGGGGSIDMYPVLWHRVAMTSTFIVGTHASSAWATQRKRGDFGRTNTSPI